MRVSEALGNTAHDSDTVEQVGSAGLIGRYRLQSILGEGGFGRVFLAYDEQLHRRVAIKVPRARAFASPRHVESFLYEAQLAAGLNHPGIVTVHDIGRRDDGTVYVVLEYIEGQSLGALLRVRRLGRTEIARLLIRVAEAVNYAHKQGLIHRDLKSDNILLDGDGTPHVADFGLAIREEHLARVPDQVAGTPAYMAPEQVRGEAHRLDGRTDLWALGVIFYQMLTGCKPFVGTNSRHALLFSILNDDPKPPRQIDETIPRELERICLKCLAKRMTDRYATVGDLGEDLKAWLALQAAVPPVGSPARDAGASQPLELSDQAIRIVPKGLRSFDDQDADFFLALLPGPRDRRGLPDVVRFWKTRIEETDPEEAFSVGLVYGPSGCGKSSLVKAGLLPRLAEHVLPVFVEATPDETEARLVRNLGWRCPAVEPTQGLPELLAALREGQGPPGKKVLLVIDQFEQWLHASQGREDAPLIRALRQCDGGRVQCLLLVRDDFWMAITRFMRNLEVRLVEGQNSAPVDLFDPSHARKVLTAFGRALGRLPFGDVEPSAETSRFLDQSIAALKRQDGRIVPVRLSLFLEMMRDKPWVPATLKNSGGFEGIGVAFLEETFAATTAPPEHRLHQQTARQVLKMLLPEEKTEIRGRMRSYRELLDASGYGDREEDFVNLLHLLDTELRLITPTDPEGSEEISAIKESSNRGEKYYQLTHDYLVPTLRRWLTLKQGESLTGRAELRLAERAALWGSCPDRRHLLSGWEFANALAFTRKTMWTATQRELMAASRRYHLTRGAALAFALALLSAACVEGHGRLKAGSLNDRLMDASTSEVPAIIRELTPYRRWADPLLTAAVSRGQPGRESRPILNARLALLPVDPGQGPFLLESLLGAEPREFLTIRAALWPHRGLLIPPLWALVEGDDTETSRRFRAACALADFDPDNSRRRLDAPTVVAMLTTESPLVLGHWIEALRPIRADLIPALIRVYEDRGRPEEGYIAACVLADYLALDTDALLRLALDAEPRQLSVLMPRLKRDLAAAIPVLERELARPTPVGANDEREGARGAPDRKANAAAILLESGRDDGIWPLLASRPDPGFRTHLIHHLGPSQVDPRVLGRRLEAETDDSVRRALILALGEYGKDFLSPRETTTLVGKLIDVYRNDPDPGIHSATDWLLRRWGKRGEIERIDAGSASSGPTAGRRWYVNRQRHTMAVVRGPVELTVRDAGGSCPVRIPHSFALATKEVTFEQFDRYRASLAVASTSDADADADARARARQDWPADFVSWYDAARYCQWLSEREGVPEEEMCYPPLHQIREGMTPIPDHLRRKGYRLPTEPEWEYGCRAGSPLNPPFGTEERWVRFHAWTVLSAQGHSWPVGMLKPNDLGLFDTLGNLFEWCQGFPTEGALAAGRPVDDGDEGHASVIEGFATQRGAAFDSRLRNVNCEYRNFHPRDARSRPVGFRVARTCD